MKFMLSQSLAQVPVKYVSVQLGGVVGDTLWYNYNIHTHKNEIDNMIYVVHVNYSGHFYSFV